jgi:CheY-like chemotaxis protein
MPLRVLLADDSPANQTLGKNILESQGHVVTVVSNGREAIDALRSSAYDVILMDVEMPVMDGISATRLIRSQECQQAARVPIVAVTTRDDSKSCLDAGMDAFLAKPLRSESLCRALESIFPRSAA